MRWLVSLRNRFLKLFLTNEIHNWLRKTVPLVFRFDVEEEKEEEEEEEEDDDWLIKID